jgi:hypothetical protein
LLRSGNVMDCTGIEGNAFCPSSRIVALPCRFV